MLERLRERSRQNGRGGLLEDPLRPWLKNLREEAKNDHFNTPLWRIMSPAHRARRGLDLCFWTCGMPRVMWLTADARYCLYWNYGNPRSKWWLSAEKQAGSNSKVYF